MLQSLKNSQKQSQILVGVILVFLGAILFSCKAIFVKLIYKVSSIDAFTLVAIRMSFALPLYVFIAWIQQRKATQKHSLSDWLKLSMMGFMGFHLASTFDFLGLKFISASMERLILFSYPTIVLLLMALFYKKQITLIQAISLSLTYLGIAFAYFGDLDMNEQKDVFLGSAYVFGAAFFFACYMIGSGSLIPKFGGIRYNAMTMIIASFTVILQAWIQSPGSWLIYPDQVYYLTFVMAIFSTVIPTFLITAGIARIGAANASLISSIGPISTIILANIFLGEVIGFNQIIGTTLVMTGVLIISFLSKSR